MNTFLLILLFISISFMDYRYMKKKKNKKLMVIYTVILVFAFVLTELHMLGVRLIGLNQVVTFIVNKVV
ncbi:hypothetical protein AB1K81_00065 [Ornithinibacillus sp. 179-J 7C1 HS]